MKVLVVMNKKGGVAKTTTVINLADSLIRRGKKVLLIDSDSQYNLSSFCKANPSKIGTMEVLQQIDNITASDAIQHCGRWDIISASTRLATADAALSDATGREYRLREGLESVADNYDYCIIDTPPALNILTVNAMTAADDVIIPVQLDTFSRQGMLQIYDAYKSIKKYCNKNLKIAGIIITRYNKQTVFSREMLKNFDAIAKEMDTRIFESKIRENVSIKEAIAFEQSIYEYDSTANGSTDYEKFVDEYVDL